MNNQLNQIIRKLYLNTENREFIDQFMVDSFKDKLNQDARVLQNIQSNNTTKVTVTYAYDHSFQGSAFLRDNPFTAENTLFYCFKALDIFVDTQKNEFDRVGRTDAGVAAACQQVSLDLKINEEYLNDDEKQEKLVIALNGLFNNSLVIVSFSKSNSQDKSNYSYREYAYLLGKLHIKQIQQLHQSVQTIVGTHDFANLSNEGKEAVRTVIEAKVFNKNNFTFLVIKGKAFAYNQVRIIAAILLQSVISEDFTLLHKAMESKEKQHKLSSSDGLVLVDAQFDGQNTRIFDECQQSSQFKEFAKYQKSKMIMEHEMQKGFCWGVTVKK